MYIVYCVQWMNTKLQKVGSSIWLVEQLKILEISQYSTNMIFRQLHNRYPDITVLDKSAKNCHIIDIPRPNDTNIENKVIEETKTILVWKLRWQDCF